MREFAAKRAPFFRIYLLTNSLTVVYIFRSFKGTGSALGRRAVGGLIVDRKDFFSLEPTKTPIKSRFRNLWVWKNCRKTAYSASSTSRSKPAKCCDFIGIGYVFRSKDCKTSFSIAQIPHLTVLYILVKICAFAVIRN